MNRIDKLLAAMTLEEKIGQLNMIAAGYAITGPVLASGTEEDIRAGRIGSLLNLWGSANVNALQQIAVHNTRLGIPLLIGFDVVHGHKTIFPIPLAEAASFDPLLWEQSAREAAIEATADGVNLVFAPMLDITRDPRWGRIAEGPGEDPWVGEQFAKAKVRGFQDAGSAQGLTDARAVAATAKHFCAYGAALAGRDYASADVSDRQLLEIYLPPFAAAVTAGCAAIMPAFHDIDGVPMTAHVPLLQDWLRRKAGFEGVIISDYNAIAELLHHGIAADLAEAAASALQAGVDIDMMGGAYSQGLPAALARGLVSIEAIDAAVRRVLSLKERLGLFEDPFRRGSAGAPACRASMARRELAREAGRRSIVLLTNDGTLPLSRNLRHIALIGPLADARAEMLGPWALAGNAANAVTIQEGLAAALPNAEIAFAPGVTIAGDDTSGVAAALEIGRTAEIIILCLGEAAAMSGEAASRANPGLPGAQHALANAILGLGKPVVTLISSGRPLMISKIAAGTKALLATWFLGVEAGHAIADVLTGKFNPAGKLPVTWPREVGQVPIFYAERPSGRPANPDDPYTSKYLDMPVTPLFFFGHGLSYSRFSMSNLRADKAEFRRADELIIELDVLNEGPSAGEETIFLFARDLVASVARPLLELKGTCKIALAPRESGTVHFRLAAEALAFPGRDLARVFEPGEFLLLVGPSADPRGLLKLKVRALPG
ncbi:MAG TPA: glycoside hydrolase family 3 N-terminal domain-containing protein [Methylocella sp.]|nr:glycoside hydrolase family 3 N-terminal domain-containing protein [Methylocella sp.]